MMNSLYYELEVEPKEKYEKAKKDVIDVINSVNKARNSLRDLTPQQRDNIFRELIEAGVIAQWLNNLF